MIIVFEGPDACGKTTLFKNVAKARNYKDTYIDRMFPSDIVYAMRRYDFETVDEKASQLIKFNHLFKPLYVFMTSDVSDIEKTLNERGEVFDSNDAEWQLNSYLNFYTSSIMKDCNKIIINRSSHSLKKNVDLVIKKIKEHEK